jgi:CheY-like chemotaxis protein
MFKILCIDDEPDAPKIANKTLRQILHDIYNTSPYEVIFETNGDKGIEIAGSDKETKLVLLDVEFKKQKKQGDIIAKELLKIRPELKVIVLTRFTETGKKISFGHKRNVVHYVIKNETASPDIQNKVKNLSHAIIEDYENKGWQLEYDSPETITLYNGKESYGINIPITAKGAITDCIQSPNRPVPLSDSSNLNKSHNMTNNNVREATDWKTWGILTREGCAKGQLKLMIGSVISSPAHQTPKDHYVTQSQFEMFMKEINDRLSKIEERLFNKESEGKAAKLL